MLKSTIRPLIPATLWASTLAALTTGCATEIRSTHLSSEASPGNEYGVIYQLTKPEFKIIRTPATATTPSKYTLGLTHVADTSHRYGLNIRPGLLTKVDQSITLRDDGSLSDVTSDSKEQVGPTIKAIGDFAVSMIGVASAGVGIAAFSESDSDTLAGKALVDELRQRVEESSLASKEQLKEALKKAADSATSERARLALKEAVGNNDTLRKDLEAVASSQAVQTRRDDASSAYQEAQKTPLGAMPVVPGQPAAGAELPPAGTKSEIVAKAEWALSLTEIQRALDRLDVFELYRLRGRVAVYAPTVDPKWVVHTRDRVLDVATAATELALTQSNISVWLGDLAPASPTTAGPTTQAEATTSPAGPTTQAAPTTTPVGPTTQANNPSTAKLKQKRVGELLKEIERFEGDWLNAKAGSTERSEASRQLSGIREELAATAGASAEYEALQRLEAIVREGPPTPANAGTGRPLQEYADARTMWLTLQTDVISKLERIAVAAADKPPPKKDLWGDENAETPLLWNVLRDAMELREFTAWMQEPMRVGGNASRTPSRLPRLLAWAENRPSPDDAEATTNYVRRVVGNNQAKWPAFVVRILEAQP